MRVTQEDPLPAVLGELRRRVSDLEAQVAERPWLQAAPWQRPDAVPAATPTSFFGGTSSTPVVSWEANLPRQHTGLAIRIITGTTAAGTSGAYTVTANGAVVDSWSTTATGTVIENRLVPVPGSWQQSVQVRVTYQRTGGGGAVYCHVTDMWARPF